MKVNELEQVEVIFVATGVQRRWCHTWSDVIWVDSKHAVLSARWYVVSFNVLSANGSTLPGAFLLMRSEVSENWKWGLREFGMAAQKAHGEWQEPSVVFQDDDSTLNSVVPQVWKESQVHHCLWHMKRAWE